MYIIDSNNDPRWPMRDAVIDLRKIKKIIFLQHPTNENVLSAIGCTQKGEIFWRSGHMGFWSTGSGDAAMEKFLEFIQKCPDIESIELKFVENTPEEHFRGEYHLTEGSTSLDLYAKKILMERLTKFSLEHLFVE